MKVQKEIISPSMSFQGFKPKIWLSQILANPSEFDEKIKYTISTIIAVAGLFGAGETQGVAIIILVLTAVGEIILTKGVQDVLHYFFKERYILVQDSE